MEIRDVQAMLPHRPPILMLDRVSEIEPGKSGTGHKLFKPEDACFEGHFPGNPILPGVLTIEALAQTALVVMLAGAGQSGGLGYLAKVNNMSFYEKIRPNQAVAFHIEITRSISQFTMVEGEVRRGGIRCARGMLTLAVALEPDAP